LGTFQTEHTIDTGELDLTVDSLRPYFHTKVFQVDRPPDLHADPIALPQCELVYSSVSEELSSAIVVYRRLTKPKWLDVPSLVDIKNLLYVVHYNAKHRFLFINSVEKHEDLFEEIAESLYGDNLGVVCMPLAHGTISRALRILNDPRFYNVGMRNRSLGNNDESYRTLTGPSADRNVSPSDGRMRSRGHVFGGGNDNGSDGATATIGISTLSKVWSNRYGLVPEFVAWCNRVAEELNNTQPVATGSNIDFLDTGKRVTEIPVPPIAAVWHEHVFKYPQIMRLEGTDDERDLTGLDLVIRPNSYDGKSVTLDLMLDDKPVSAYRYNASTRPFFARTGGAQIQVLGRLKDGTLEELLNVRPPTLFLADFSTLVGDELYAGVDGSSLDKQLIRTFDAFGSSVDIQCEVSGARKGMLSVHEFTQQQLMAEEAEVVLYDHRTSEVADFLWLIEDDDAIVCSLAHCKKAGGAMAAARVNDSYEVAGQIVKCLRYQNPQVLLKKLTRRVASGSELRRGSIDKLERMLTNAAQKRFEFRLCLVQPGLSAAKLNEEVSFVLAAASDYVKTHTGFWPSFWISP
jgi:hypothetical protein